MYEGMYICLCISTRIIICINVCIVVRLYIIVLKYDSIAYMYTQTASSLEKEHKNQHT